MPPSSSEESDNVSNSEDSLFQHFPPWMLATAVALILVVALGIAHEGTQGEWLNAGSLGLLGGATLCLLAREDEVCGEAMRGRLWRTAVSLFIGAAVLFVLASVF